MHSVFDWLIANHEIANAVAAIFGAAAALIALFVSVVALWLQRRHDVLSVKPIPEVTVADYEDSLRVRLRNFGVGPMVITGLRVLKDGVTKPSVVDWMPPLPNGRPWNHFAVDFAMRTLSAGGMIPVLELTQADGESQFSACRDAARRALCPLTVEIEFTDVYGTRFKAYSKPLSWFGRNLPSAN
jgi:hypothetical protein